MCLQSYTQARPKPGEGSKRALGFEAADAQGQADAAMAPKSAEGAETDLREMLGARDELMNRCLLVPCQIRTTESTRLPTLAHT